MVSLMVAKTMSGRGGAVMVVAVVAVVSRVMVASVISYGDIHHCGVVGSDNGATIALLSPGSCYNAVSASHRLGTHTQPTPLF